MKSDAPSSPSPPSPRLTHVAIRCADLDHSIAFYEAWCGLEVIHRRGGADPGGGRAARVAWLGRSAPAASAGDFWIVLVETRKAPGPTSLFDHLGFDLPGREAVDELAARAQAAGLLQWPPQERGAAAGYLCGLRDPDGNVVEFSAGQRPEPRV